MKEKNDRKMREESSRVIPTGAVERKRGKPLMNPVHWALPLRPWWWTGACAFYSDNPSSNPTKRNEKETEVGPFEKLPPYLEKQVI